MIGVLTHHWTNKIDIEKGKILLNRNGMAQSKASGFVSRQTLYSRQDPTKITTLVLWDSEIIYECWRSSPERARVMSDAGLLWSRHSESERFDLPD